MKRLFAFLATFSLVETIGRRPALAGILMLLGVGGGAGIANLITPSIIPQPATYFNQNQSFGTTTNGLKPNGGTAGAMNSRPMLPVRLAYYIRGERRFHVLATTIRKDPFTGAVMNGNTTPGLPSFFFNESFAGQAGTQWWKLARSGSCRRSPPLYRRREAVITPAFTPSPRRAAALLALAIGRLAGRDRLPSR